MPKNVPSQLIFNFSDDAGKIFLPEDFIISKENETSYNFLQDFFLRQKQEIDNIKNVILKGEIYCGKSHLLHIFAEKFEAQFIKKDNLKNLNLSSYFCENKFYILENFSEINDEELLLHTINSALEAKSFLILSTEIIPDFALKDLDSRIKNIFVSEIKNPQNELTNALLIQGFAKKQLKINSEVIDFLTLNLPRSYQKIFTAIKLIENYCHENKKNLNLSKAKEIIAQL